MVYNNVPLGLGSVSWEYNYLSAGFITATSGAKLVKLLRTKRVTLTFNSAAPVRHIHFREAHVFVPLAFK